MSDPKEQKSDQMRRHSDQDILESWKAIANHLNRSVRTVRRWESFEDLPVHRHQHTRGSSVYAYGAELDAWQRLHRQQPEAAPRGIYFRVNPSLLRYIGIAAAAVILGAMAGNYYAGSANDDAGTAQDAGGLAASNSEPSDTQPFADRAMQLLRQNSADLAAESEARALMFPILIAWLDGDLENALQQSQRLREELPLLPAGTQNLLVKHLVSLSLSLGRIDDARELVRPLNDPVHRHELEAAIMFAAGDKQALKQHLASGGGYKEPFTALLLAMSGLTDQAAAVHAEQSNSRSAVVRAITAMGNGRPDLAKTQLQSVVADLAAEDGAYYFVGPDMLASLLKAEGNLAGAVMALETTSPRRVEAAYNNSALFWLMCQRQLARLYREAGREPEASRIEDDLRELMIIADDDFPLAQSLRGA